MSVVAPPLVVDRVVKTFGRHRALAGVSANLQAGRIAAVLGPNGAGKSTLLSILSTLMAPTQGTVTWGDQPLRPDSSSRAQIGYVGHEPGLYGELTATENLVLFARLHGIPTPGAAAAAMLERVGLSDTRKGVLVRSMSRGMQQRVALARALIHHPRLLLLDEPSATLDPSGVAWLRQQLTDESEAGRLVVVVTHDLELAGSLARHIVILSRGRVVVDQHGDEPLGPDNARRLYRENARA